MHYLPLLGNRPANYVLPHVTTARIVVATEVHDGRYEAQEGEAHAR